ncbi:MAG: hypothetical protein J6C17_00445 [Clostridia bacterium]|nr:hypothetical protein [Clostridia bacterium]
MKKRVFSLLLIVLILILNVVPVFAWTDSNFLFTGNETIPTELVSFMTENPGFNYYYVFGRRNGSNFKILLYSVSSFSVSPNEEKNYLLTYTNNTGDQISVHSTLSDFSMILEPYQVLDFDYGGDRCYYLVEYMVSKNNNCVNSQWCSPDVYTEENPDDYEEDGVVIKGLTGFFNNIISSINGMVDNLITELKKLIGLPPEGYFNSKFEEIKTNLDNKYNFSSVFEIFNNLKSIQAQKPVFDKTFNFSFDDINIPFHFKIDFDFIDSIRDYLFAFIRAFGYFYLIIYNMNQYYLLFRGQRFFYDMRDSYSYTDSNGKEHSHERGEKKWY